MLLVACCRDNTPPPLLLLFVLLFSSGLPGACRGKRSKHKLLYVHRLLLCSLVLDPTPIKILLPYPSPLQYCVPFDPPPRCFTTPAGRAATQGGRHQEALHGGGIQRAVGREAAPQACRQGGFQQPGAVGGGPLRMEGDRQAHHQGARPQEGGPRAAKVPPPLISIAHIYISEFSPP